MKQVYVARNPSEAHFVKGLLEAENIACDVQGEMLWGARGELPLGPEASPTVWIANDASFDRARVIIEAYENREKGGEADLEMWKCSRCGEELEGQFLTCWKCGEGKA
ncbi:MAG: DUF2007 domain-containing protein [Planctomycetes bacterium]|nr:DUF2007 domain-containing protein [Planctomycetota bacterium]